MSVESRRLIKPVACIMQSHCSCVPMVQAHQESDSLYAILQFCVPIQAV